jgi:hypothetical protein
MRGLLLIVASAGVSLVSSLGACDEATDPPLRDAGAREASDELPDATEKSPDFDPAIYPTDCTVDADCIQVTPIRDCSTCCTADVAVRKTAEADYRAAQAACTSHGACLVGCPERVPACVDQRCVLKAASDAGL